MTVAAATYRLLKPLRKIPTWAVLFTVVATVILHLTVLTFYTEKHKSTAHLALRDSTVQQVMNIIHMVQATPSKQIDKALAAFNSPNITTTITEKPAYPVQAVDLTYWRISRLFPSDSSYMEFSLQVHDGRWLNIHGDISSEAMWPQLFLLIIEALIVVIVFFYAWSISRFTRPLKAFQHAAERLGVDVKPTRLSEFSGPLVVRQTAQAMNRMQQRIQDLIQDRTLMLAAISHDLRTPITRLKLRASKIDDKTLCSQTVRDLDEMELMISEILSFARNDYDSEQKIKLDLKSLLQSLADELTDMGFDVSFTSKVGRAIYYGRKLTLKRAFTNIIQNAVKYGKKAKVTMRVDPNKIIVYVDDEGPGIADEEQGQVFTPFYRCDRSRSRQIAGTGLGLAVAHDAICAHQGEISLKNLETGGLRVTITLFQ